MFNRTILALKGANHRLPSSALLSALLLVTAAPVTQAANNSINISPKTNINNSKAGYGWAEHSINPAAYCDSDISRDATAQTTKPKHQKHQSAQRRSMDCMLTQLHIYQQNDKSARQQYLAYKAQAWLNYAYHEDSVKSKTPAGSQALQTGTAILQALQNNTAEQMSITTDIPTTSALMRPDLWATLNALKASDGISVAPREVAFSEVALIWAAADQCEHGWRQSGTHFRMADRWLEQAREAYVNRHDSTTNVALEELINRYFKLYAPLDKGDDSCRGQVLPTNTQTLHTETDRSLAIAQTTIIPIPTATHRLVY
ncbi:MULTISPECIES: hypothetical protein [Psychrobacter]|uniref:hypothetical protein n=1 Tax=Psychrobacter TaxID=497 RepID=UPI001919F653|nr:MULTISPECIES: hypothetical protein [Psychrobacter]